MNQASTANTSSSLVPEMKPVPANVEQVVECIKSLLQAYLAEHGPAFNEPITSHMSFDYLGLDSLARVGLISALEKEFSVTLDPTAAYDFVTVHALAQFVWSEVSGSAFDARTVMDI
jgi:acyl carrier protein